MAAKRSTADRDAELEALTQQIADGVAQVAVDDAGEWKKFLDFAQGFHTYSFRNQILVYLQNPNASLLAGYRDWQSRDRQVMKGEKGLRILAPVMRKLPFDKDGNPISKDDLKNYPKNEVKWHRRMVGARPTSTFDVSQTEGADIPMPPRPTLLEGEAPEHLWDRLAGIVTEHDFTLSRRDLAAEGNPANGYTNFTDRQIVVRTGVSDAQAAKTLAHEIGHMLLHGDVDTDDLFAHRGTREVEAESVAYMVSAKHGLDTSDYTFRYVAGWSNQDPDAVIASADRIMKASRQVLDRTLDQNIDSAENQERATKNLQRAQQQERAAQSLQDRAPQPQQQAQGISADRHAQMQQAAHQHYQQNMQSEEGTGPRNYLDGRKLGALVAGAAVAGYATKEWTDLVDHLHENGFTDAEIMAGGLGVETKYGTVVDRFRERITLPIHDDAGDIVGFIGRAPDQRDERAPKYLNTPAVDGFNKSEIVYGLHQAADRENLNRIVVTEGPFDAESINAAALHQDRADVLGVATAGTALTETHAEKIAAIAQEHNADIVLNFDPDDAGQAATQRAVALLPHDRLKVAPAVGGQDPAEIHQNLGSGPLMATVDVARPHYQWELDRHLDTAAHLETIPGRAQAIADAQPIIAQAPDLEHDSLWRTVSEQLNVPLEDIDAQVGFARDEQEPVPDEVLIPSKPSIAPMVGPQSSVEESTLSSNVSDTEQREAREETPSVMTGQSLHALATDLHARADVLSEEGTSTQWQAANYDNLYHEPGLDQVTAQPEVAQ